MEEILQQYLAAAAEHSRSVRDVAEKDRVIPILIDWGGFHALGLDGQVYVYLFDDNFYLAGAQGKIEPLQRYRNTVYYLASKKYPELNHLNPVRQDTDRTCPFCDGSGIVDDIPDSIRNNVLCYCGGLGWIPADDVIPGN